MPSDEVNSDAIVETIKEYERWRRKLQVISRRINRANGEERENLEERRRVIKKHLTYYENLLSEMKAVYAPVTVRSLVNG